MKFIPTLIVLLCCSFITKAQQSQVSNSWTAFSQSIDMSMDQERKFILKAAVKAEIADSTAWAGLWARVDMKNNENGFFDNMGDRPIRDPEWKEYTIEGTIGKNAERLLIGGLMLSDGTFYFDNFSLQIEDSNGIMTDFPLGNADFEKTAKGEKIDSWLEGIGGTNSSSVLEYTLESSSDAFTGAHSLMITGEGTEAMDFGPAEIKSEDGYAPQLGVLISMLDDLKERVEYRVKGMSQHEIDHLHDENANRIGALVMHLAAAEAFYQVRTFENRGFSEEEAKKWGLALDLGKKAQEEFKGKPVSYYLEEFTKVRERTKALFKSASDEWLLEEVPSYGMNNYYAWFHVMEHQSSHLGQVLFLAKRIPPEAEINAPTEMKN